MSLNLTNTGTPPVIETFAAAVILPYLSTVICETDVFEPYVPGITPVALFSPPRVFSIV